MNLLPVALEILFLLGHYTVKNNTGLHVNAIYKELVAQGRISKNKKPVINAHQFLEQSGLLTTIMRGEQREIKSLTPLGIEFVKLANDLDMYVKSCSEVRKAIRRHFDTENSMDKKVLKNKLRSKGWATEEIDEWDNLLSSSKQLIRYLISPYEVISVMFIRYTLVLSKVKNNGNAINILNQIMMDKVNEQLSNSIITDSLTDSAMPKENDIFSTPIGQKIRFVDEFMIQNYSCNRFTDMGVGNLLSSLSDLLQVKDQYPQTATLPRIIKFLKTRASKKVFNVLRKESFCMALGIEVVEVTEERRIT